MSIKTRAFLLDASRSRLEGAYLTEGASMVLSNVPCEMTYKAEQMFIEHEDERHHFLPVVHMTGKVLELKGKFPFNVSTLYFSDEDAQHIPSDLLYYPRPEELVHMIKVGRFFTKQFEFPEVLTLNQYSLPVYVNLKVIPPYDVSAYEAATYNGTKLANWESLGIDKDNLPIFYVEVVGTGVTRETDKLLDYYGIDFDENYPVFALTADAAGYTSPPLMEYIPEPVDEVVEEQVQDDEELYMTPAEEELIQAQKQAEAEAANPTYEQLVHENDAPLRSEEDVLLAKADSAIARRIDDVLRSKNKSFSTPEVVASKQYQEQRQHQEQEQRTAQRETEPIRERETHKPEHTAQSVFESDGDIFVPSVQSEEVSANRDLSRDDYVDDVVDIKDELVPGVDVTESTDVLKHRETQPARPERPTKTVQTKDIDAILKRAQAAAKAELEAKKPAQVQPAKATYAEVESANAFLDSPDSDTIQVRIDAPEKKLSEPDTRETYKKVEMDLNPEANENIKKAREEKAEEAKPEQKASEKASTANGADVADASEQVKVDDASITAEVQRQILQQGRKVSEKIEDIAEKAESAKNDVGSEFGE